MTLGRSVHLLRPLFLLVLLLLFGPRTADARSRLIDTTAEPESYLPLIAASPARFYVANGGSDGGDGSWANPWRTINHALDKVPDGATIVVRPGVYHGEVRLDRISQEGITIRSEIPYRARLQNDDRVVSAFYGRNLTLEGFDITHAGPGAGMYVVQIQDAAGDGKGARGIVLRNNVLHDSYNNDILKVNNGAADITIEHNVFYNQGGPETDSHIDVNSVRHVTIQDNIFFNDFAGSGRPDHHNGGHFVLIKDSNGASDAFLGSQDITVRRNLFLNWQGAPGNSFVALGDNSAVTYFQAQDVLIENNLMLGNGSDKIHAAFKVISARNVMFRHNTVVGDLPANTFAIRLDANDAGLKNENISFINNLWADPTGTMGAEDAHDALDFSDSPPSATASFTLHNNLYWNGGHSVPSDPEDLVNFMRDPARIIADPKLQSDQAGIILPRWDPVRGRFGREATTIDEAFSLLARRYGQPLAASALLGAADPLYSPADDLFGNPRSPEAGPALGAVEPPADSHPPSAPQRPQRIPVRCDRFP